jgi:hypothetical protein
MLETFWVFFTVVETLKSRGSYHVTKHWEEIKVEGGCWGGGGAQRCMKSQSFSYSPCYSSLATFRQHSTDWMLIFAEYKMASQEKEERGPSLATREQCPTEQSNIGLTLHVVDSDGGKYF